MCQGLAISIWQPYKPLEYSNWVHLLSREHPYAHATTYSTTYCLRNQVSETETLDFVNISEWILEIRLTARRRRAKKFSRSALFAPRLLLEWANRVQASKSCCHIGSSTQLRQLVGEHEKALQLCRTNHGRAAGCEGAGLVAPGHLRVRVPTSASSLPMGPDSCVVNCVSLTTSVTGVLLRRQRRRSEKMSMPEV